MILNVSGQQDTSVWSTSKAVLSQKSKKYFFATFSDSKIFSCRMGGTFAINEANDEIGSDDPCKSSHDPVKKQANPANVPDKVAAEPYEDIDPNKRTLNFYLLLMSGVRVVFTKTLAFSAILTIRGLLL